MPGGRKFPLESHGAAKKWMKFQTPEKQLSHTIEVWMINCLERCISWRRPCIGSVTCIPMLSEPNTSEKSITIGTREEFA